MGRDFSHAQKKINNKLTSDRGDHFLLFHDSRCRRRGSVSTMTPHQCLNVCDKKNPQKETNQTKLSSLFPRAHIESEENHPSDCGHHAFEGWQRPPSDLLSCYVNTLRFFCFVLRKRKFDWEDTTANQKDFGVEVAQEGNEKTKEKKDMQKSGVCPLFFQCAFSKKKWK